MENQLLRAMLFDPQSGKVTRGGAELLDVWRSAADSAERGQQPLIWVDFSSDDTAAEAEMMRGTFGLHENAIEDAQRNRHPPKFERYGEFTFLLLKGLDDKADEFGTIQISFFLSSTFLVTRHIQHSASLDALWDQLEQDPGPFREGTARLFTIATRRIVDRYLRVLLRLEERLEDLEDEMRDRPSDAVLTELSGYKSDLKRVTRIFAYHDRIFGQLRQHASDIFTGDLVHDINDVYDRMERAASLANLYHGLASDLMDSYISIASHRLNGIMKILTIITAIFVPLSFIAGLYGMNFEYMPELRYQNAYFLVLGVMTTVVLLLLVIFRRNRWL